MMYHIDSGYKATTDRKIIFIRYMSSNSKIYILCWISWQLPDFFQTSDLCGPFY